MAEGRELALTLMAHDKASEVLEHVGHKLHGLGEAGKFAAVGAAAVAAVGTAVGGSLIEMATHAAHAAMEVRKLSIETGLSAEEASKLRYAGERLGVDTDGLSKSLGKFSKGLEATHPILEKYGIDIFTTDEGSIDLGITLGNVADKFAEMPDGVEKTAIALNLFGKSGKDMIPLLNKGSDGIRELGLEADKLGLVFSQEGVDSAFKFGQAQKDLGDRFEAVKNTIGLAVLPVLTQLIGKAVEIADVVMPKVIAVFRIGQTVFSSAGEIIGELFGVISGSAPGAGAALKAVVGSDVAEAFMQYLALIRDTFRSTFGVVRDVLGVFRTGDIGPLKDSVSEAVTQISDRLKSVGEALSRVALSVLAAIGEAAPKIRDQLLGWAREFVAWVGPSIQPMLKEFLGLMTTGIKWLADHADEIGDTLVSWGQKFGEFIFTVAIPALVEHLPGILLTIGEWVTTKAIPGALVFFGRLGIKIIDGILAGLGELKTMVGNAIGSALRSAIEGIDFWVGPFHVSGRGGVQFSLPSFGGFTAGLVTAPDYNVPQYAAGTPYVPQTGLALVHRGEAIVPASQNRSGFGGGGGGGGGVTIQIFADVVDPAAADRFVDRIDDILRRRRQVAGGSW